MGEKAREIVGVDVDQLITKLKKTYADEWLAYHYYWAAAEIAEGRYAPAVASELKDVAEEELEHAEELAERIGFLGGEVIRKWSKVEEMANCKHFNIPDDPRDIEGFIRAVIEAERCAIAVYKDILDMIGSYENDPSTYKVVQHILDEELEHEDRFESVAENK